MRRSLVSALQFALFWAQGVGAESRFGRPVMKLANPKSYRFFRLDDNNIPFLAGDRVSVSCIVYRGTKRYYVEVGVWNRSGEPLALRNDFVVVEPGKAQLYLYAFEQPKNKKAPFHVAVTVGRDQFGFSYKD